ncbi:MAG: SDR family NAD(P)-dependent oxidoreductase [Dokdonella sp.]
MTAVVIGASSGLGRALASELAQQQQSLLLVASDARDLQALASDLRLRHGVAVHTLALDLASEPDPGARVLGALQDLPAASALLLPIGYSREDDDFSLSAGALGQLLAINLHAPMVITQALLPQLVQQRGVVIGFGSVAAVRGRRRNVVYAACKRGLQTFFESLRQRWTAPELRVQFYALGFMRSNLTHGMLLPLPRAEPARIARHVVRNLRRGSFQHHLPHWWAAIGLALRCLPWPLFRRLKS